MKYLHLKQIGASSAAPEFLKYYIKDWNEA